MPRSNSAVTLVANERGLPDEPYFEAGGVYVAMLREPRARYLSQYLHLKQYGEAYLRVRAAAAAPIHVTGASAAHMCGFLSRQGEHPKWPAELRHLGITPHDGVPPLLTLLAGARSSEQALCALLLLLAFWLY